MFVFQVWSGLISTVRVTMFCLSLNTGQSQRELLYSAVRVENMRSAELWTGLDCLPGWLGEGGEHNSYTPTSPNLSLYTIVLYTNRDYGDQPLTGISVVYLYN